MRSYSIGLLLSLAGASLLFCGCGAPEARFRLNAVYMERQKKEASADDLTRQQYEDVVDILAAFFGTPDEPNWPSLPEIDTDDVVELSKLTKAAGAVSSDRLGEARGLYREHCIHCHGANGDGMGPTAAFLNPYPRDYRMGVFKFKSTPGETPPTNDDLHRILVNGVPGTAMPSFKLLAQDELEALEHYVRYLAIRGEVERSLIRQTCDMGEGERLLDLSKLQEEDSKEGRKIKSLQKTVAGVMKKWIAANEQAVKISARPEYGAAGAPHKTFNESISAGRELFFGNVANCAKCHGDTALGDGTTNAYDKWTEELEPKNPEALEKYLALGALQPRYALPRNLRQGIYRGGRRPIDIFWRIKNGIAGSPMPAANAALKDEDIWDLVNYVQSLPFESISRPPGRELYNRERL